MDGQSRAMPIQAGQHLIFSFQEITTPRDVIGTTEDILYGLINTELKASAPVPKIAEHFVSKEVCIYLCNIHYLATKFNSMC